MSFHEDVVRRYLKALEDSDYRQIISLFTGDAVVKSPLYGVMKAQEFYRMLFMETASSKIKPIHICSGKEFAMAYFKYEWTLENGSVCEFECVDVFRFSDDGKIRELTIIYDTSPVRNALD